MWQCQWGTHVRVEHGEHFGDRPGEQLWEQLWVSSQPRQLQCALQILSVVEMLSMAPTGTTYVQPSPIKMRLCVVLALSYHFSPIKNVPNTRIIKQTVITNSFASHPNTPPNITTPCPTPSSFLATAVNQSLALLRCAAWPRWGWASICCRRSRCSRVVI